MFIFFIFNIKYSIDGDGQFINFITVRVIKEEFTVSLRAMIENNEVAPYSLVQFINYLYRSATSDVISGRHPHDFRVEFSWFGKHFETSRNRPEAQVAR